MSCPPRNYTEYKLINHEIIKEEYGYPIVVGNDIEFNIRVGSYYSFTKSLKSGIFVLFYVKDKAHLSSLKKLDFKIYSKKFGELQKLANGEGISYMKHYPENSHSFGLNLLKKQMKQRRIKNDTIFVELGNKKKLTFVRKN